MNKNHVQWNMKGQFFGHYTTQSLLFSILHVQYQSIIGLTGTFHILNP